MFVALRRLWFAMQEKKGVATFFLPRNRPTPPEPGCFVASWFLWVRPRYAGCTYKNTTCTIRNKKVALYRKGQKSGLGVFLAHRFGDGRLITHVSIGHISIHTAIGIAVYLDSCMGNYGDNYICGYVPIWID